MTPSSGDKVRVTLGPYTGWEGEVLRADAGRVTLVLRIFGKEKAIIVRASQIEPASNP
jgi:transcription antitermination factor NusG